VTDTLTVMGLDLSLTSTGCAKIVSGPMVEPAWTFRIRSARRGWDRLESQVNRIGQAVKECDPDLIAVEGPAYHAAAQGSYWHENAGLWWAVTSRIWKSGRPMVVISPAVLKKFATGSGAAKKSAMVGQAIRRFGLADIGEDEADGLWLAAACCQHYGLPAVSMPAAQVDALESVVPAKKGKPAHPAVDWPVSLDWDRPAPAAAVNELSTGGCTDGENHARRGDAAGQQQRADGPLGGFPQRVQAR
jgi:Holliday junction resolvasome RuvABC endonuclease subunit